MKTSIITVTFLILMAGSSLLSAQESNLVDFNSSWTLHDLAASEEIPVKQLMLNLGLDYDKVQDQSLSELGISQEDAEKALASYREAEPGMVSSIVLVGMLIVFASLVVVAFCISLFKHFHKFGNNSTGGASKTVKTDVGLVSSRGDMSEKAIAAVITAVFLHEEEVDSENRLLLTWKRVSARRWQSGEDMPNALHFAARRGR